MVNSRRVDVDLMFRAFSDRTRLRILHLLQQGELCVCDIVEVVGLLQPAVSRHLAYLRRSGLVSARRKGLWMHYSLVPPKSEFHRKLMACLACCFGDVPEFAADLKKYRKTIAAGCCSPPQEKCNATWH